MFKIIKENDERTKSEILLDKIKNLGFRQFEKEDYYGYDPENFSDGSKELIYNSELADILVSDASVAVEIITEDGESYEFVENTGDMYASAESAKAIVEMIKDSETEEELISKLEEDEHFRKNLG